MLKRTFTGGMPHEHGWDRKTQTRDSKPIPFSPKRVAVSMFQMIGAEDTPLVKVGDTVRLGQRIGEPAGPMGVPVHASVSGKVVAIEKRLMDNTSQALCVVIENDGQDLLDDSIRPFEGERTPEAIISVMREAGLVGMGGAMFPTHIKFRTGDKPVDYLLLNGAECEPFLTVDDQLMRNHPERVVEGAAAMMTACGAKQALICIEDNKPEAIRAIEAACAKSGQPISAMAMKTRYPQGGERQLIQAATGREVPAGKLPLDARVVVSNVGTAAALAEALETGMPLLRRAITVSGAVEKPQNVIAPLGTVVADLLEFCGGLTQAGNKVLLGGPMTGCALPSVDVPSLKGTTGITVLTADESEESACIRCGACVGACPAYLMPFRIDEAFINERMDVCASLKATECIHCGCCSYVCPAKRHLAERVFQARLKLRAMK